MNPKNPDTQSKSNPDGVTSAAPAAGEPCAADDTRRPGPPREGGGTTGAGNLSPEQANRTGGATDGVEGAGTGVSPPRRGVQPDA